MTAFGIIVLLSVVGSTLSIMVQVSEKAINVTSGETANLFCTFSTNAPLNNVMVQWTLYPVGAVSPEQVYYYQSGFQQIGTRFQNRLSLLSTLNTTMNASISITNMQLADAGTYTCEVHNPPDFQGTTDANTRVNVLEKPSHPFCAVHGDVETGHLVTLTCHSEKGSPAPTYNWTRLENGISQPVLGLTNVKTGILYFRNISQFEFGKYQCNASNVVGFSTCTVNLNSDANDAVIAGAVIGALLAIVFIALLAWFISHQLKKRKYKEARANEAQAAVNYKAVPPQEITQD
ncbi:V-set and immunoglobulin domain-containing protein 1-like [Trichomycterus rosablanca]|uniref:V-set and immunoglobulin domain-containing protein 1-like n=1 Tax=Trichomycterus rosablanca TaxID=2290929 RepID=UPI002F353799